MYEYKAFFSLLARLTIFSLFVGINCSVAIAADPDVVLERAEMARGYGLGKSRWCGSRDAVH